MPKPEVLEFVQLLLREVRDKAIVSCDTNLDSKANSVVAKRWRNKLIGGASRDFAAIAIPDCVDDTLFYLLHAIDTGMIRLLFKSSDGKFVDLTDDGEGEMAGWFMGTDGWRAAFSSERFIDDFENLK